MAPEATLNPSALPVTIQLLVVLGLVVLNGFFVASGTPEPITSRLRQAIIDMTSQRDLQKRLRDLGIVPGGQTEAQVKAVFEKDRESFAAAVAAAEIKK